MGAAEIAVLGILVIAAIIIAGVSAGRAPMPCLWYNEGAPGVMRLASGAQVSGVLCPAVPDAPRPRRVEIRPGPWSVMVKPMFPIMRESGNLRF